MHCEDVDDDNDATPEEEEDDEMMGAKRGEADDTSRRLLERIFSVSLASILDSRSYT